MEHMLLLGEADGLQRFPLQTYANGADFLALRALCKCFYDAANAVLQEYVLPPWHNGILPDGTLLRGAFTGQLDDDVCKLLCKYVQETQCDAARAPRILFNSNILMWLLNSEGLTNAQRSNLVYALMEFNVVTRALIDDREVHYQWDAPHYVLDLFHGVFFCFGSVIVDLERDEVSARAKWERIFEVSAMEPDDFVSVDLDAAAPEQWRRHMGLILPSAMILVCRAMVAAVRDARVAYAIRIRGNEAFKGGDFLRAADLYSAALWFSAEDDTLLCNRALAYLKISRESSKTHWAIRALLDAQDAYEIGHGRGDYNYKAINHMIDAALAAGMQSSFNLGEISDCRSVRAGAPCVLLDKFGRLRTQLDRLPAWSVYRVYGPSGLGLRAPGQSFFGMQDAVQLHYQDSVPLVVRAGIVLTAVNVEAVVRSRAGVAARRQVDGALDLLVLKYRDLAVCDPAFWSEAFVWATAAALARPEQSQCLAMFVALRWKDDPEMRSSRPWNAYLSRNDERARSIIARYAGPFSDIFDSPPPAQMVLEM